MVFIDTNHWSLEDRRVGSCWEETGAGLGFSTYSCVLLPALHSVNMRTDFKKILTDLRRVLSLYQ